MTRFEPLRAWRPEGIPQVPEPLEARTLAGPWYAVVDEIRDDGCRFVIDPWPDVDRDGRLVFGIEPTIIEWAGVRDAQLVITDARNKAAVTEQDRAAANRPLRIGDTFALWPDAARRLGFEALRSPMRGGPRGTRGHEPPGGVVDVSTAARVAAHAAVEAVGGGELREHDLRELGIPPPEEDS